MNDHAARHVPPEPTSARLRSQPLCSASVLPLNEAVDHRRVHTYFLLAAALTFLLVSIQARANQVYKACGPKWAKQAKKLEAEKLSWLFEKRIATVSVDLDADGKLDAVDLSSTPSFRNCDIKNMWDRKETTVRISYGNGKTQLFHWISDQLVEKITIYRGIGRILLVGVNAAHDPVNKWVDLRRSEAMPRPVLLAAHDEAENEEDPVQVAVVLPADSQ